MKPPHWTRSPRTAKTVGFACGQCWGLKLPHYTVALLFRHVWPGAEVWSLYRGWPEAIQTAHSHLHPTLCWAQRRLLGGLGLHHQPSVHRNVRGQRKQVGVSPSTDLAFSYSHCHSSGSITFEPLAVGHGDVLSFWRTGSLQFYQSETSIHPVEPVAEEWRW